MRRRTSRANHVLLALVGLVLLAAGGYLIARNRGWIPHQSSHARLYTHYESQWLHHHNWIWYAVAALAVIVGLLALQWLLIQPRIDRLRVLRVDPDFAQRGRTEMAADVLTTAIEDDVAELHGVTRVRALLVGSSDAPSLVLRVYAHPASDLAVLKSQIAGDALRDARTAMDTPDVPAQVYLHVGSRDRATRVVE